MPTGVPKHRSPGLSEDSEPSTHSSTPSWDQEQEFVLVQKELVNISKFHPTMQLILTSIL